MHSVVMPQYVVCLPVTFRYRDHMRWNHRPLKLRTDGGQSRVRELGSIDLFVVTSLKMNQLSPNFEHKFPIVYGILAANFFALRSAFPVLLWPPVIWLADGHCEMLLVFRPFFSLPNLGGLLASCHKTLLHVRW